MERAEVEARAKQLWGESAYTYDRSEHPEIDWNSATGPKWVGCLEFRAEFGGCVYGNGHTWEEALEDAEWRAGNSDGTLPGEKYDTRGA